MATAQAQAGLFRNGSARRENESRFRYGYICRLIDDGELRNLPEDLRVRTRATHKAAYWKSVALLRRDAELVLRLRRERMAAQQMWDFQALVNDYARVQLLFAKLAVAGLSHSIRLGAGIESARQACREFEFLLTNPALPDVVSA